MLGLFEYLETSLWTFEIFLEFLEDFLDIWNSLDLGTFWDSLDYWAILDIFRLLEDFLDFFGLFGLLILLGLFGISNLF